MELSELITKNITGCKQNEEKILTFELAGANIIIEKEKGLWKQSQNI